RLQAEPGNGYIINAMAELRCRGWLPSFLDTMEEARDDGRMDVFDRALRRVAIREDAPLLVAAFRSRARLRPRLGAVLYQIDPETAVRAWADIVSAPGDLEMRRQA